jgi:uncharacterized lipoprotein YbaY
MRIRLATLAAAAMLVGASCASSPNARESAWVAVIVNYSPSRLPIEDVFLQVSLEERSESGGRRTVGRATERLDGHVPPAEVRVHYDPGKIDATARYTVRAWIEQRSQVVVPESSEPVVLGNESSVVIRLRS